MVRLRPTEFREGPWERLERHKPKGLRVVLRGLGSSNAPRLPGGGGGDVTSLPDRCDSQRGSGGADCVVAGSAREIPEAPALGVLDEDQVEVLVCRFGKGMKPSQPTIGQAVLWIGRLGGHLNCKRDGMPGVRTLWRGLHDLTLLVAGFQAGKDYANSCG